MSFENTHRHYLNVSSSIFLHALLFLIFSHISLSPPFLIPTFSFEFLLHQLCLPLPFSFSSLYHSISTFTSSSPFLSCFHSLVSAGHACLPPWLTNNPKDVTLNSVCSPPERGIDLLAGGNHTDGYRNELKSINWKNEWLPGEEKPTIFKLRADMRLREELCVFGLVTMHLKKLPCVFKLEQTWGVNEVETSSSWR